MGSLYTQRQSGNRWVEYYRNGRPTRESTGADKEGEGEFLALRESLPAHLKSVADFADIFGWRIKSKILGLT
jgi:hypothetical protein